jgi:hypothetical protein
MAPLCQDHALLDLFRTLRPQARGFTWTGRRAGGGISASRLDRFYVPAALAAWCIDCAVWPASRSDHRPVAFTLLPLVPPEVGPGVPRLRLAFWGHDDLRLRFLGWLQQQRAAFPFGASLRRLWRAWEGVKRGMHRVARPLNREARARALAAHQAKAAALAAADAARDAVEAARGAPALHAALHGAAAAERAYSRAAAEVGLPLAVGTRVAWLHLRERPQPAITRMLAKPRAARFTPAVRTPDGRMLLAGDQPEAMAQCTARFFAAVSAAQPRNRAAEGAVLGALAAYAAQRQPPPDRLAQYRADVEALSKAEVLPAELWAAACCMRPGKAPGPDGIPPELYRKAGHVLLPMLAAVCTAVGEGGSAPPAFLRGVISVIYKGQGDRAALGNYRPITLLNTDYKLLGRALATRLGPVMATAIGPEQSGFLPGRLIGDNICLLQLLPQLLQSNADGAGRPGGATRAAVALLDFRKAFDTVSRPFLFACMERLLGPEAAGAVSWARALLGDTRASALVNGVLAPRPERSYAGVRQGCPLSPALYLFVAAALAAWLRHPDHAAVVGVYLGLGPEGGPPTRECGPQYADDTEVLLPGLDEAAVGAFVALMATFGDASGQRLNLDKSVLLPVGVWPAGQPLPAAVAGIKVVQQAEALGMSFSNARPARAEEAAAVKAAADWPALVAGVEACYTRISRLHLSAFGRGFAASAYGISKVLYHAEFAGLPAPMAARLEVATTKLVDRAMRPGDRRRRVAGLRNLLLPGSPKVGGFGVLAWRHHVTSRHLSWASRLLCFLVGATERLAGRVRVPAAPAPAAGAAAAGAAPGEEEGWELEWRDLPPPPRPPWVDMAEALLRRLAYDGLPAAFVLLSAARAAEGDGAGEAGCLPVAAGSGGAVERRLPFGPLLRMGVALHALGLPAPGAPDPGPWCWHVPLWGNPLLPPFDAPPSAALQQQWAARQQALRPGQSPRCEPLYWRAVHGLAHFLELRRFMPTAGGLRLALGRVQAARRAALAAGGGPAPCAAERERSAVTAVVGRPWHNLGPLAYWPDRPRDLAEWEAVLGALWQLLPPAWHPALGAEYGPPAAGGGPRGAASSATEAAQVMLQACGWPALDGEGQPQPAKLVSPLSLSVREGTALQQGPSLRLRADHARRCVRLALGPAAGAAALDQGLKQLVSARQAIWPMELENQSKEALWRLWALGARHAGGCRVCWAGPACPCGWNPADGLDERAKCEALQRHVFWAEGGDPACRCPVADAVAAELRRALPPACTLACADLWLCRPPANSGVDAEVWRVVCMAALTAMARGNARCWALRLRAAERRAAGELRQQPLYAFAGFQPVGGWARAAARRAAAEALPPRVRAARDAARRFWTELAAWVELADGGEGGPQLGPAHPFVCSGADAQGRARLRVNIPPAAQRQQGGAA